MNTITLIAILMTILAMVLVCAWLTPKRTKRSGPLGQTGPTLYSLANIAEGTHDGAITRKTDAAITERFLLGKIGSDVDHVAICGAADTPIGVITDEAAAAEELVNINLLNGQQTQLVVASAAIALGALVEPAANGRVATLGVGAGTHHVVGRALNAAANAGDLVEIIPMYFLRVI